MQARTFFLWIPVALLGACTKMDEEAISGRYFIDNRLGTPLYVQALVNQGPPVVIVDSIPASTVEVFMNVMEGIRGDAPPSLFLETLVITSNGDTIYSGVNDADWLPDDSPSRSDRTLVIE